MFLLSRQACFLTRTSSNGFSLCILHKTKRQQNFKFLTKTMDQPLWKNGNFVGCLTRCFHSWERFVIYIKRFFTIYFYDLLYWDTRRYRVLQRVTGGYRGLHEVARGYKSLEGLRKNIFLTRTSRDTFSWSILYKNQSGRKWWTYFFWKKANFAFFINRCSNSLERLLFHASKTFFSIFFWWTQRTKNFNFLTKNVD